MATPEKRESQLQQELYHVHRGIEKMEEEEKKISLALKKKKKQTTEWPESSDDSGWSDFE